MTMIQKRKDNAIDLSDGSINISILPLAANRSRAAGLDHIGFSAEDDQEQIRRMEAAGAIKESTRFPYEEKFKGPEGIIVDVGHWPGAASLEKSNVRGRMAMGPSPDTAPTQQSTTRAFDLDVYCARINYTGSRDVSVETLKALHFAHVHNVRFENLDIHLGKPLSLEPADLFSKIVTRKRDGYCYEVNKFFTMVLRACGFQVPGLQARVFYSFADFRPRSHQLLLVTVDKEPWIADVGFGSCCLREPLRLKTGVVNEQGPESFRLRAGAWPHVYPGGMSNRALARSLCVYSGALRARRLRAIQLLELDFAPCPLDTAESLHDSDERRTHRRGR